MQLGCFFFSFFLESLSFLCICVSHRHTLLEEWFCIYLSFNSHKLVVVAKVQHVDYKILSLPQTR